jgi:uncharacterized protein YjdB
LWFEVAVQSVILDENEITLYKDSTYLLTATVFPAQALNKNVTWQSSNETIATVTDGLVTAIAKGTATITVTTEEGGFTAICIVNVELLPVQSVILDENEITLYIDSTHLLTATVLPEEAENKNVIWESSDETIATVTGGLVTAIAKGTATITVTTIEGGFTAICIVNVLPPSVQSVILNEEEITLYIDSVQLLTATVLPEKAENKNVVWESSDEAIATVTDGLVTAIAVGIATITGTTEDGGFTATCLVNVVPKGSVYEVINSNFTIYPNPVSNVLNICTSEDGMHSIPTQIKIYSNNGALIRSLELTETEVQINVSDLASGVFFIRLLNGYTISTQWFV